MISFGLFFFIFIVAWHFAFELVLFIFVCGLLCVCTDMWVNWVCEHMRMIACLIRALLILLLCITLITIECRPILSCTVRFYWNSSTVYSLSAEAIQIFNVCSVLWAESFISLFSCVFAIYSQLAIFSSSVLIFINACCRNTTCLCTIWLSYWRFFRAQRIQSNYFDIFFRPFHFNLQRFFLIFCMWALNRISGHKQIIVSLFHSTKWFSPDFYLSLWFFSISADLGVIFFE